MSNPEHLPACIDNLVAAMQGGSPVRANMLTSIIEQVKIDFEALIPLGAFDHDPALKVQQQFLAAYCRTNPTRFQQLRKR